jgi:predicted DNA-binding antitoxin AbrB/MazE fold protein
MQAIYEADQGVIKLDQKLALADRTRVKVVVEPLPEPASLSRRLSGSIVIDEAIARHIVENEDLIGVE